MKNMSKKVLIVQGGWSGHDPENVSQLFGKMLAASGYEVEISSSLESFSNKQKLLDLSLIVPVWTMGKIPEEYAQNVADAVASGVGMAGCHGGMCDAFRECCTWQFLTGAQWVAHPGGDGVTYEVNIKKNASSFITNGIDDFQVTSEQYYIHVDPAVNVLATTRFPVFSGPYETNGMVDVPVLYTKTYGKGRIFYSSLGHTAKVFEVAQAYETMRRGLLWAAK